MNRFMEYPPNLLVDKEVGINLRKIMEDALKLKDYELFRHIISLTMSEKMEQHTNKYKGLSYDMLAGAIKKLDVESVQIIAEEYVKNPESSSISPVGIATISGACKYWSETDNGLPKSPEDRVKQVQILKSLFKIARKRDIDPRDPLDLYDLYVLNLDMNEAEFRQALNEKGLVSRSVDQELYDILPEIEAKYVERNNAPSNKVVILNGPKIQDKQVKAKVEGNQLVLANFDRGASKSYELVDYELWRNAVSSAMQEQIMDLDRPYSYALKDLLDYSIKNLEVKVVQIIVEEHVKNNHQSSISIRIDVCHNLWKSEGNSIFFRLPKTDEEKTKQAEILKILFKAKLKHGISVQDVLWLRSYLTHNEFYKLIKDKGINLNDEKFNNFRDFSQYGRQPLSNHIDEKSGLADIILTRTYSEVLSEGEVRAIYQTLIESGPLANATLLKVALDILKNNEDSVKITFNNYLRSTYDLALNVISINTDPKQQIGTYASEAIHEFGHWAMNAEFENGAQPFNLLKLGSPAERELLEKIYSAGPEAFNNAASALEILSAYSLTAMHSQLKEYESGAKQVLIKTAQLLQADDAVLAELKKYEVSADAAKYLETNTYIGLFFANSLLDENERSFMPGSIYKKYIDAYIENKYPDVCVAYNPFFEPTMKEIEAIAMEEFLPKIVRSSKLGADGVFFLERISDWIYKGTTEYSSSKEGDDNRLSKELIVRYLELKVAGVNLSLLEAAFSGLEQYLEKYFATSVFNDCQTYNNELIPKYSLDYSFYSVIDEFSMQSHHKPYLDCTILA